MPIRFATRFASTGVTTPKRQVSNCAFGCTGVRVGHRSRITACKAGATRRRVRAMTLSMSLNSGATAMHVFGRDAVGYMYAMVVVVRCICSICA